MAARARKSSRPRARTRRPHKSKREIRPRRPPASRPRRRWWRWLLALPAALTGLVAAGFLLLVATLPTLPDPAKLVAGEGARTTVLAADGTVLAEWQDRGPVRLRLGEISPHLVQAVLAVEDRDFFAHPGVDPRGLLRALWATLTTGDYGPGGSTLTQQLAKNLLVGRERTLLRKLRELAAALYLELTLSKEEILELYLNHVYFGAGAWGAEAAARTYFAKSAAELDALEAAMLAGLLKAPSRLSPFVDPTAARARTRTVLRLMVEAGALDAATARTLAERPLPVVARRGFARHPLARVRRELAAALGPAVGERVVRTRLDPALQRRVERLLATHVAARAGVEAAAVVLDSAGFVRALASSDRAAVRDRADGLRRQPGSAFKPFVYAAALEMGLAPDVRLMDRPVRIEGWSPRNWDGRYRGEVSLEQAFALSLNTVAVTLQERVGRDRVIALARRAGITAPLRPLPSLALGTEPVTLLELTRAVGSLVVGRRLSGKLVVRVQDGAGRVQWEVEGAGAPVVRDSTRRALRRLMRAAVRYGTARQAAVARADVGAKTGTSQGPRDGWIVGFVDGMVVGVWVGRDDGRPVPGLAGGGLPARIFTAIGRALADGTGRPQPDPS